MPRERLCKVCGGWHQLDSWPHNCMPARPARSRLSAPMVIMDTMDPVQSMLDGKLYDSKATLRATYRAAGVTEVGNDVSFKRRDVNEREVREAHERAVSDTVDKAFSQAGLGA